MAKTYTIEFSREELSILHLIFCSGMVGGDPFVRSKLYDKIKHIFEGDRTQPEQQLKLPLTQDNPYKHASGK